MKLLSYEHCHCLSKLSNLVNDNCNNDFILFLLSLQFFCSVDLEVNLLH